MKIVGLATRCVKHSDIEIFSMAGFRHGMIRPMVKPMLSLAELADRLGRLRCAQPCVQIVDTALALLWRVELRRAGVPLLELNAAAPEAVPRWIDAATDLSREFFVPVLICTASANLDPVAALPGLAELEGAIAQLGQPIADTAWLQTRQVALTQAIEQSPLNQEFRRQRERCGWIHIGWQPESALQAGNGLSLAWSSPLPLRRIRDFAARCPEISLQAPDPESIATEVAAQGISVTGWRFAVK